MTETDANAPTLPVSGGIERRTVLTVGAWSVPVLAMAVAAPSAAASTVPDCRFDVVLTPSSTPSNPLILQATSSFSGQVYTVVITSTISGDTTIGEDIDGSYVTRNLAQDGSGINGSIAADGSADWVYSGFGPSGAIVLNQRTSTVVGDDTLPVAGTDRQTLSFAFYDGSNTLIPNVGDFSVTVFDISSAADATPTGWRQNYWDAVGFSVTPTAITNVSSPYPLGGAGTGTLADPYHRIDGSQPTVGDPEIEDRFDFGSFPSGGELVYTQYDGRQGWHFIAISGLQFTVAECLP
ncbi:hypothetical protein N1031_07625 [Herbiconiux moechotypicola]|uniref:Uncharacterized protein n=1 Tax=Herbiconiux moechotypicola TaxID=637393 RepID=A0ABP5QC91_9MICO|nr:hypothetical protein [Herbiconiux moechotypicola]MCS5729627.1 hypothetical protein [Herbiconiux moechotypicola]